MISFGVIGMGVGAYFLIRYFKLKKAYETTLNTTDASLLINSKTAGVPDAIIPDEYTETADDFKGTEMDETDEYTDQELFEIQSGMGDF